MTQEIYKLCLKPTSVSSTTFNILNLTSYKDVFLSVQNGVPVSSISLCNALEINGTDKVTFKQSQEILLLKPY